MKDFDVVTGPAPARPKPEAPPREAARASAAPPSPLDQAAASAREVSRSGPP